MMNSVKNILFNVLFIVVSLFTANVFAAQMPVNSKQLNTDYLSMKNVLRKHLFRGIKENIIVPICFSPDPFATSNADAYLPGMPSDVFLPQNGYTFIGKSSGELIIVNKQKNSSDTIKIYKQSAVSSLAFATGIIIVGSASSKFIHRWYVDPCKKCDSIELESPVAFLQIVDDLLFVIDVSGNLIILDWCSGIKLHVLKIGIHGAISNVVTKTDCDGRASEFVVMTSKSNYFIDISSFLRFNIFVNSLGFDQLAKEVSCCL